MKKFSLLIVSLLLIVAPYFLLSLPARADNCAYLDNSLNTYNTNVPSLPKYCTIGEVTRKVLNVAFLLIGGVSLLFLMIGGFRYMTAGGNEEQVAAGKKTALYAIVGLVVVLLAVTIVNAVVNLVLHGRTF